MHICNIVTYVTVLQVIEKDKKEVKRLTKESVENKGYADELEVAFNELHERCVCLFVSAAHGVECLYVVNEGMVYKSYALHIVRS